MDFAPLDCAWLCVSLSVKNVKKGTQLISAYCRYVVYHNARAGCILVCISELLYI